MNEKYSFKSQFHTLFFTFLQTAEWKYIFILFLCAKIVKSIGFIFFHFFEYRQNFDSMGLQKPSGDLKTDFNFSKIENL